MRPQIKLRCHDYVYVFLFAIQSNVLVCLSSILTGLSGKQAFFKFENFAEFCEIDSLLSLIRTLKFSKNYCLK